MKLYREIEHFTDARLKSLHSGMWAIIAFSSVGSFIFAFSLYSDYVSLGAQLDFKGYKILFGMIAGLVLSIFISHALFYKIRPEMKSRIPTNE